MRVSGRVSILLQLDRFEYPDEVYAAIRAEIGEKSPARMFSEYIYRLLQQLELPGALEQVSAIPEEWTET